ncbi:MAG: prepilin-type N-terminal cleavage/methylation domain-containing protein [Acidimicrobiales bacterium]
MRARTARRAAGRPDDTGVTLVEVIVAMTILMVALIPLSYLFSTSLISAGQSNNQQTALSIAERWVETLSNATPPVDAASGAVIVDTSEPPAGPAATFTPPTVTSASNGHALDTVTSISVTSTTNFAAASASVPQTAYVVTGTAPNTVSNQITYTSMTATTLSCPSTCSTSTTTMATGDPVTQTEVSTPTEPRGNTTYTLRSEYEWATVQNSGVVSTTIAAGSNGLSLPQSTIDLASVTNFLGASTSSPQTAKVATSAGVQTVTYTGITTSPAALTGVTGGVGTMSTGGIVTQTPKPNLCTTGTPQLLKLTVSVSWGPNADVNSVQDSVMLNYPPSGVQTLGFIALQFTGDSTATDAQGDPWSERVTAIPVTITGPEDLTIYPDQYGCAFAQVLPGNYTVSVANATSGVPAGTTYGTPSFVANAAGTYTNYVWSPPTTEPQGSTPSIPVTIGTVTRVDTSYSANYPSYDQGTTVNFSYPTATALEDGVTCPGAGGITCVASGESSNAGGGGQIAWTSSGSSWSTANLPTGLGLTRLTGVACVTGSTACIGVGYGTGGAVILHGTTGSTPTLAADSLSSIAGMSAALATLNQVTCPSATQCVAIGSTSTGAAVVLTGTIGATASSDTWVAETLPATVASLSSLQCPVSATGCAALATTTTAGSPTIVSGPATGGTWVAGTFTGVTVSALSNLVCPSATACMATGTGKVGASPTASPVVLSGVAGGSGLGAALTWTADTLTGTTPTSLSAITCPPGNGNCLVTGSGTAGTTTGAFLLYGPPAGPLSPEFPEVGTTPISSIGQVACSSATQCIAIGLTGSTPVIFTGTISGSPTWANDTVPSTGGTVSALDQVVCPAASSCLVSATGTISGVPTGSLFDTTNGTTWSTATRTDSDSVLYFDGISCTSGSSGTCAAVGATPTRAVVLSSTGGPSGSFADVTPNGLSGNYPTGIPIEINNANLSPSAAVNAVEPGYTSTINQLPVLFPFQGGYGMWAGDCLSEDNTYNVAQAVTIPGGTSGLTSGMPTPTVPLGLLAVQVTHKSGANAGLADANATVSLTATTSGCGADGYSLQATGADGLSRTEVPYGSYTLTVAGTGVGSVVVAGNTVTFTPTSGSPATGVLPTPVSVSV